MFFRSTGIFLHVIFFRYVPIWALRTTTLEIESIEARAGCKSCGLVHLDKTLSLSWSMFPPSPIPGQRSLLDELGKVVFFLQKMCFRSFKKIKKHFAAKEIKSYLLFFKKIRTFSQKFVCFGGNGQISMWARFSVKKSGPHMGANQDTVSPSIAHQKPLCPGMRAQ